ncbi:hypothetical protein SIO70_00480 [Chitinophaga sancti]|uniref:IS66 family insertion sequence element accessory protein TnpA n=1 Tax=Chitinophaga sancti TaxID=1004 RepID=UPI002A7477F0|nr:hypothetical protein [Chitinophaga sancti]WPQ63339.1 hypothetical protein SIO70_00480 [Chitinophaga sancti]
MEQKQSNGLSKEQKMFALIGEHEGSSMTVKDFCELYDLSPGTYHYWQKKYHAQLRDKPIEHQSSFTLLKVTEPQEESTAQDLFAEYRGIRFYREPSVSFLKALIS